MPKRQNRSSFGMKSLMTPLIFLGAILLGVVVYAFQNLRLDDRSGAYSTDEFLQTQGKFLVYKGSLVTLKGVNFDNISALGAGIGSNNIDDMTTLEDDYKLLASFGSNHARLGLSYTWWEKDPAKFFQVLDQHVAWAKENRIWITLLNFVNPDGNDGCYEGYGNSCSLWTNQTHQKQLTDFWIAVATRYASEPAVVGYDLVNEPTPPGPGWCNTWWDLAQKMRNTVAQVAPNQLIFIEACSDPSFARVFKEVDGSKAKNVVYEVHDYDPMRITHPGYNASTTTATYPGSASTWIDGVQKTIFFDKSTFEGTRYPEYSTAEQYSLNWANKNDVPLYIGEWGAQGWTNGYIQFIRDKAEVYNALGVHHAYYTWRHQVTNGWRWGVFTRDSLVAPEPEKLEAMKVSFANAYRPDFGSGPVISTPLPSPVASSVPTPQPSVQPTNYPTPSPVIVPPVIGGYPKVLPGTNSKITLTEVKPREGSKVFIKAAFDSSVTGYQVDWYINGKWTTQDKVAPFHLGGDSNGQPTGFTLPAGITSIRAVVYYSGQQFIESTTSYNLATVPTPSPVPSTRPTPVPTPVPSVMPTPSPTAQTVTGFIDVFNEWNTGYCARIMVKNASNKPVKSWKLAFNLNQASITSKWNGTFRVLLGKVNVTPNAGFRYVAANTTNNALDYCATKKGSNWRPTDIRLTFTQ